MVDGWVARPRSWEATLGEPNRFSSDEGTLESKPWGSPGRTPSNNLTGRTAPEAKLLPDHECRGQAIRESRMKAVAVVDGELRWREQPDPVPGDTELLVSVRAAGAVRWTSTSAVACTHLRLEWLKNPRSRTCGRGVGCRTPCHTLSGWAIASWPS